MKTRTLFNCFVCILLLSTSLRAIDRDKEYFKSPDHWELTLGDQKDYFEAGLEKFCSAGNIAAQSLDYVCGTEHSLHKMFKDKYWFKGNISSNVSISLAKNERESFQVAVLPLKDKTLCGMTAALTPLVNDAGQRFPEDSAKIFNVEYVETTNACYPVAHKGWWPDPLVPMTAVDVPPAETRAFWIEIRSPADIPAGAYRGILTISGTNTEPFKINVNVEVWDFTLPKEQIVQTCTWLSSANCGKRYGKDRELEMHRVYAEYFLDHKINPLDLGNAHYKSNDYSAATKDLENGFEHGLSRFQIPRLKGEALKKYCDYLNEKGWLDKAMIYGYKDEPHPRDYPAFRRDSEAIRATVPDLKIFMAESPHPGLYGAVDIWWSSMPANDMEAIRNQLAGGQEVWWYRCGIPVRLEYYRPFYEYPSDVLLDRPSIDIRIFYLMIWKFKMTPATFFWCGMHWPKGFDKWPAESGLTSPGQWNGDGYVVYPGENGPLPSIRLECMTDGIEDFEYIHLLKNAIEKSKNMSAEDIEAAKKLLAIPPELIVFTYHYNKDPHALFAFRKQVAEMILKLSR
ncbi:MAG: DUF6067 family protein [Kiritimatiellae bacterium]|nr:DUF6067 family protein [Kiritimatiellia bacterium]